MDFSEGNEIVEKIKQIPIVSRFDKSLEFPDDDERYVFFLHERPGELSAIDGLKTILELTEFKDLHGKLIAIAHLIQNINCSKKLPLYGAGFSLSKGSIRQLKIYYILTIIKSEAEVAMASIDNSFNEKILEHLLQEIDLENRACEVKSLVNYMSENGNDMHIVGINIERNKPLSLKLYFRMKDQG